MKIILSEAEGRPKGEPRSGVGESFHPAPGGSRVAAGDQRISRPLWPALHTKKAGRSLLFRVEHRRIELLTF